MHWASQSVCTLSSGTMKDDRVLRERQIQGNRILMRSKWKDEVSVGTIKTKVFFFSGYRYISGAIALYARWNAVIGLYAVGI